MKPYAERKILHTVHVSIFREVTRIIERAPALDFKLREIRCHELATFIDEEITRMLEDCIQHPALIHTVIDGKHGVHDHSWIHLATNDRGISESVLDVYAIGAVPQVQLLDKSPILRAIWGSYVAGPPRDDLRLDVVEMLHAHHRPRRSSLW